MTQNTALHATAIARAILRPQRCGGSDLIGLCMSFFVRHHGHVYTFVVCRMRRYRICPNKFAPMAGDTSHSPTVAVVGIVCFLVHPEGERFLCSEVPRPSGFCPRHEHSAAIRHLSVVRFCVALFRFFSHRVFFGCESWLTMPVAQLSTFGCLFIIPALAAI